MKKDSYVQIISPNGDFRYGYIREIQNYGTVITVDLFEEGASKIAFEAEMATLLGYLPETSADYVRSLSDVEKHVAALLAQGKNNNEIASELNICSTTVRSHNRALRMKFQVSNKNQLVAICQGLKLENNIS